MPVPLIHQVPFQAGQSTYDFDGLGKSIAESIKEGRNRNALIKIGAAAKGGDLAGARDAAFEAGKADLGLQINNLLTQQQNRAEDVGFRNSQAERAQANAERSFGLDERRIGASQANAAATRELAREQFDFNRKVQSQTFQLKLMEIDAKNKKLDNILSPGQQQADKEFAKEYVEFRAAGGYADVEKQLKQLEGVLGELKSGKKNLTGPVLGSMPDAVTTLTNPDAVSARQRVEEVVQRSLRITLGAQFTQKEGEALIARAYNPRLSEQENASRLEALVGQIREQARQKQAASDYFEKHGTIAGFGGHIPAAPTAAPPAPQAPVTPAQTGDIQPGTVEDGYRFKGGNPSDPASWEQVQ